MHTSASLSYPTGLAEFHIQEPMFLTSMCSPEMRGDSFSEDQDQAVSTDFRSATRRHPYEGFRA